MVRIGIIGPGRNDNGYGIGTFIIREILNNSNALLTAIGGTTIQSIKKSIQEIENKYSKIPVGTELYPLEIIDRFFSSENIDMVIIASPTPTHLNYIELSIQNNKHVFCEKPLFSFDNIIDEKLNYLQGLYKMAEKKGLILSVNCQRAYIPVFLAENKLLPELKSELEIVFSIGAKTGLLPPKELFELCISHLSSILIKFNLNNQSKYSILNIDFNKGNDHHQCVLSFSYLNQKDKLINGKMRIEQSKNVELASVKIRTDNSFEAIVSGVKIGADFKTSYRVNNNPEIFSRDLLSISIDKMVDAVSTPSNAPLLTNNESYCLSTIDSMFWQSGFSKLSSKNEME
ncbi:MAG: Gfo/Idh/MocA family oxidoreductase [Chitinophagales bacterium]